MIRVAVAAAVAALLFAGHADAQGADEAAMTAKRAQVAQSRTRIVVTPRRQRLSPDAKRYCEAWLEQEYRVSGTVIVPRQRCWWQ
jgi:hypothetical protein